MLNIPNKIEQMSYFFYYFFKSPTANLNNCVLAKKI